VKEHIALTSPPPIKPRYQNVKKIINENIKMSAELKK
jgi:hypothetical protein